MSYIKLVLQIFRNKCGRTGCPRLAVIRSCLLLACYGKIMGFEYRYGLFVNLFSNCIKWIIRKLTQGWAISTQGITVPISPVSLGKKRKIRTAEESCVGVMCTPRGQSWVLYSWSTNLGCETLQIQSKTVPIYLSLGSSQKVSQRPKLVYR